MLNDVLSKLESYIFDSEYVPNAEVSYNPITISEMWRGFIASVVCKWVQDIVTTMKTKNKDLPPLRYIAICFR